MPAKAMPKEIQEDKAFTQMKKQWSTLEVYQILPKWLGIYNDLCLQENVEIMLRENCFELRKL